MGMLKLALSSTGASRIGRYNGGGSLTVVYPGVDNRD